MSEPFVGQIIMFGGNFAIRGFAMCDGQLLPIAQNTALFSLLGTTYGGDGRTTFGLPDLRGRVPMHMGTGTGLSPRRLGEKSGTETSTLTVSQMPSHNHAGVAQANSEAADSQSPIGNLLAKEAGGVTAMYSSHDPDGEMSPSALSIAHTGGGQAHSNLPPYQVINFLIALMGIYPSRG
jgi:microcystin-dependent protein